MLINTPHASSAHESDVTPESRYHSLSRRRLLVAAGGLTVLANLPRALLASGPDGLPEWLAGKLAVANRQIAVEGEAALTPFEYASHYNNFSELGPGKGDPARFAASRKYDPWSVEIDGEVARPGCYALEGLLKPHRLEERIYRFCCVEGWSMVIPWLGLPLGDLLKQVGVTGRAGFARFEARLSTRHPAGQSAGLSLIAWPYVEGLRIDEAMHPLTILAVGMYGRMLPGQNGAPLRLVVPWKYGFKSIKSIVRISLTRSRPKTTWEIFGGGDRCFYANVQPTDAACRGRALPDGNGPPPRPFNGYAEVAAMYT
jgi:sulfoxide reductase catalytic subunit YedY